MLRIAIHQPNFFPWYPFFQKIQSCDIFILLNNAQFVFGNYHNRYRLHGKWCSMSVNKGYAQSISSKQYVAPVKDWEALKRKMPEYTDLMAKFDDCISKNVVQTNGKIIRRICQWLDIKNFIADDTPTTFKATERLIYLCQLYANTRECTYISGISGREYMDMKAFERAGIKVEFQKEEDMIKTPILQYLKEKGC